MITRRRVALAFCLGALTLPLASLPQSQGKIYRIGLLLENEPSFYTSRIAAFIEGMRELGYVEGKDYVIESKTAHAIIGQLPALALELLASKVDLMISSGTPSAMALRNATSDVPILVQTAGDPVGSGLAESLKHPGRNVTGLTGQTSDLTIKRLDLLRQLLPAVRRVGFLYNPENGNDVLSLRQFEMACAKLKIDPIRVPLRKREDVTLVFDTLKRGKVEGLIVTNASTNGAWVEDITRLALRHRVPAIYGRATLVELGGLISYAADSVDLHRRAAAYAVKILKGAKAGDLPIEQPLKYELAINLKTAKTLGLKIPDVILLRADKVIE